MLIGYKAPCASSLRSCITPHQVTRNALSSQPQQYPANPKQANTDCISAIGNVVVTARLLVSCEPSTGLPYVCSKPVAYKQASERQYLGYTLLVDCANSCLQRVIARRA
jgi:hypothetical protein